MKYLLIVGDGMGDYPLKELGGKTPLQAAKKPNMDWLAKSGSSGLLDTIPKSCEPGSDVAILSILGYKPELYYPGGLGPIEAAGHGISMGPNDLVMRANIITVKGGLIKDYSAGQIRNDEAKELIAAANKAFGSKGIEFRSGVSYRNFLIIRDADVAPSELVCNAPHTHTGEPFKELLIKGSGKSKEWAERMNGWMLASQELFEKNSVNAKRKREGRPPANMLWFWGPGKKRRDMPPLRERLGLTGAVITGVDVVKGLSALAGLEVIEVPGATAYSNTNYEGKADAAIKALETHDLVLLHIKAPDPLSHEGKFKEKVKAIEDIDKRVVGRVLKRLGPDCRIGLLCDHFTPISKRTHTRDPVPFIITGCKKDSVEKYDEESAKKGAYGLRKGPEFIELLVAKWHWLIGWNH